MTDKIRRRKFPVIGRTAPVDAPNTSPPPEDPLLPLDELTDPPEGPLEGGVEGGGVLPPPPGGGGGVVLQLHDATTTELFIFSLLMVVTIAMPPVFIITLPLLPLALLLPVLAKTFWLL